MLNQTQPTPGEPGGVARLVARSRARRRGISGGFTLVEIVFALAILALVLFGLTAVQGANQQIMVSTSLQEVATAAAQAQLESWLSTSFNGNPAGASGSLIDIYKLGGKTTTSDNNAYTGWAFPVAIPGAPTGYTAGNAYGKVIVREPTAAEAPFYNRGNGPKWTAGGTPPNTSANGTAGVTCLLIFVTVHIPSSPGHSAVDVALSGVRYQI